MTGQTTLSTRDALRAEAVPAVLTGYRLFWIFFLSALLGDLIETVFWLLTRGELTSRSSLLYGPVSLVWGFGAVLLTLVFHRAEQSPNRVIFFTGAFLGGAYEYFCSLLQEKLFGLMFWDYSHLPFNLNGRINLLFCLCWGALAVFWVRLLDPLLLRVVASIPRRSGRRAARGIAVFLLFSTLLSGAALARMEQRRQGQPADNAAEQFLDRHYPDQLLYSRYPNMAPVQGAAGDGDS